jgi:hypothetical protein
MAGKTEKWREKVEARFCGNIACLNERENRNFSKKSCRQGCQMVYFQT